MSLKVFLGDRFSYDHETLIFESLARDLETLVENSEDLVLLIGNFYYNNQEIDAMIVKKDAIIVIDFKNYGGKIEFSENGKWKADGIEVKGGNKINPFIQIRTNKYSMMNFFKNRHNDIVKSDKLLNYGHINGVIIFHRPIQFDDSILPINLKHWFLISDYDSCINKILSISNSGIKFINSEIELIAQILNVTEYEKFQETYKTESISESEFKVKPDFQLSPSQEEAIEKISSFLDDKHKQIFILNGAAGSGKTFLIRSIVDLLLEKERPDFKILAPTGRAVDNIRTKIVHDIRTIHSLIYKRQPNEENVLDEEIDSNDNKDVETTNVYELIFNIRNSDELNDDAKSTFIVDECSLLSDSYFKSDIFNFGTNHLLADLLTFANIKNSRRKIIFIGDDKQIMQGGFSVNALNIEYFEKEHGLGSDSFELNGMQRYDVNNEILNNAINVRQAIENNLYNRFEIKHNNSNVIKLDKGNILDQYSLLNDTQTIIIKYKNEQCIEMNRWLRENLFKRPETIFQNDLIMFYKNFYLRIDSGYPPEYINIPNGVIARIIQINEEPENIEQAYDRSKNKVILKFRDVKIRLLNGTEYAIKVFENYWTSNQNHLSNEELRGLIVKFHQDFRQREGYSPNPKKMGHQKYYEAIQADPYFNSARVKPAYSITCHKAQGSEWQNVLVDFDHGNEGLKESFFRWAYTAITRSVNKLYIINSPRFGPYSNITWQQTNSCLTNKFDLTLKIDIQRNISDEDIILAKQKEIPIDGDGIFIKLFSFLYSIYGKKQINIERVEHNLKNYYVRYFLEKESEKVALNFVFDGHFTFHQPTLLEAKTTSMSLGKEIISLIKNGSIKSPLNIDDFPAEKQFLVDFYEELSSKLEINNISILSIYHGNYSERYVFTSNGEFSQIDFSYDSNHFITSAHVIKTTSLELINDIKKVIDSFRFQTE